MKRILFVLAAAALAGCDLSTGVSDSPTDPATETFAPELQVDIPNMTKTAAGTYYKDLKLGDGATLTGTPTIILSYQEFLKNGFRVIVVGESVQSLSLLVAGLADGMQGMKVNGERLIVVPSALGFGNSQTVPGVPPNSTLVFDVVFHGFPVQ